ncbi:MAG: hypothetical protein GX800_13515, partial [Clostridiaceae bacterium]|nr:hypothetical protein [Clostridiaceae bacterium]
MEEQTSNFTTNYVLSQRKDVLNIISGTAFANVKQEKDLYRLLRNSTLNNTDDCLSPKMQARREILLLADRLKPHPKNDSLLIVANFEPSFDKLEEVIEIVVG